MYGLSGRTEFRCFKPAKYRLYDNVSATAKNQYIYICVMNIIAYFCAITYKNRQHIRYTDVYIFRTSQTQKAGAKERP